MSLDHTSVIIPTYNRARVLGRAIDSVLAAVEEGDEVIVVDDGSTDDTRSAVAWYEDRIRYVRTENGGAGRARNRGIREARCPLVAFLDSDDEWMEDRLALGRALLHARPDILFCFSDFGLRSADAPDRYGGLAGWHRDQRPWGEILGPGVPYSQIVGPSIGRKDLLVHIGDLYPQLLGASYVPVQTLLVRRGRAGSALRFAEDLPTYEDWECSARIARAGPAAFLDCATAWQWGHAGPRLTDSDELQQATARITIVGRVWASDPEFLARHPGRAESVLRLLRVTQVKGLLVRGRVAEARESLGQAGGAPLLYRVAAMLPGMVVNRLAWVWRWVRVALRRASEAW